MFRQIKREISLLGELQIQGMKGIPKGRTSDRNKIIQIEVQACRKDWRTKNVGAYVVILNIT